MLSRQCVPSSAPARDDVRRCGQKHRLDRLPCPAAAEGSRSSSGDADDNEPSTSGGAKGKLSLPRRGFFSLADTKAEVYSRSVEKFDPMKKGGRYKPEFIWNTDWQTALQQEEALQRKVEQVRSQPTAPSSGFLSLNRVAELDRMDVDLSDVLQRKRQEEADAAAAAPSTSASEDSSSAAARQSPASTSGSGRPPSSARPSAAVPVFTRREAAKLSRVSKSAARTAVMVDVPEMEAEKARQAEEERRRYEKLKVEQQLWTLAFSATGFAATYLSYSQDVAVSYTVGALGGFLYLRLLSKSVDALGGEGLQAGMAAQPRLLIPVILALGYNRWNQLYSESLGVQLQLLPMLVGFFTYKLALVTRQYKDVFDGKL